MAGKLAAFCIVVALLLALIMGFVASYNSPPLQVARAEALQQKAAADLEAYKAQTAINVAKAASDAQARAQTLEAAVFAQRIVFLGFGLAVALLLVGLTAATVVAFTAWSVTQASTIRPTAGGQFPMIRVGGFGWSGLIDPNRTTGLTFFKAPTIFDLIAEAKARAKGRSVLEGPGLQTPLSLPEAATLQLAAQASAVALTAAATRHAAPPVKELRPAIEAVTLRSVAALPVVEDEDPDHVDRLLLLTAPDAD